MTSAAQTQLLWGLTPTNLIALIGVVVSLVLGAINYRSNAATRRNALALDAFGHRVRGPVEKVLSDLESIIDAADDIVRSSLPLADKLENTDQLKSRFHAARRVLARLLTDCDRSPIVAGNDWSQIDEGHTDEATEAFELARRSEDLVALQENLHRAVRAMELLRTRTRERLDAYAKSLMN